MTRFTRSFRHFFDGGSVKPVVSGDFSSKNLRIESTFRENPPRSSLDPLPVQNWLCDSMNNSKSRRKTAKIWDKFDRMFFWPRIRIPSKILSIPPLDSYSSTTCYIIETRHLHIPIDSVFTLYIRSLLHFFLHRHRQHSHHFIQPRLKMNRSIDEQRAIFGPFIAQIFLTLSVLAFLTFRRLTFIKANKVTPEQLQRPGELARISPTPVVNVSDNLKNLFEIPVLFYAFTLYLFVTKQVDALYVLAAWFFFIGRVAHSIVHCTFNNVIIRFYCFLFSCACLLLMVFRAGFASFLMISLWQLTLKQNILTYGLDTLIISQVCEGTKISLLRCRFLCSWLWIHKTSDKVFPMLFRLLRWICSICLRWVDRTESVVKLKQLSTSDGCRYFYSYWFRITFSCLNIWHKWV